MQRLLDGYINDIPDFLDGFLLDPRAHVVVIKLDNYFVFFGKNG